MDPLRSLKALVAAGTPAALEGKVERRDERQGTVVVRLAGNESVVAQGSDLQPGDRVSLARGADGTWIARPLQRPSSATAPLLSSWMTEAPGSELGEALRTGEPRRIRAALVDLWRQMDASSVQDLPPALQEARRRGLPPLVSRGDGSPRQASAPVAVPLALRAETEPGTYRGEIPGRRMELAGPPGLRLGEAGLWTESVLSEILSVWLPAAVEDGALPGLPARVAADASGARRLLDHLGVDLSPQEAQSPSFRALVSSLVRAGAMYAAEAPLPPAADLPSAPAGAAPSSGAASSPHAPVAGESGRILSPTARPDAPADPSSARRPPVPNAVELLDPAEVRPSLGAPSAFGGNETGIRPDQKPAPRRVPGTADSFLSAPSLDLPDAAAVAPSAPFAAASVAASARNPSAPQEHDAVRPGAPAAPVRDLPSAVALRVVLAWLVSEEEPTDALLRAAVGGFRELPEALQVLARALDHRPEDFEAVAAFLRQASSEEPLLPRDLGLDRPVGGGLERDAGRPDLPQASRPLSQAIVEDLARALSQGRPDAAAVLREALGSLVGEALDRTRDPSNPMASAPWTMPPSASRPDSGRVVVRDQRKTSGGTPERTVVEVSMNPTGLGSVDARLELRGDDLDVVFHARETATVERIREHLPELRGVLVQLGLQPRDLDARAGKPGAARRAAETKDLRGGLDIRA